MLLSSKGFAGNRDHVRLMQQALSHVSGGVDSGSAEIRRYVWVHVESSHRTNAGNSGDLAQCSQSLVTQIDVVSLHVRNALLGAGKGCYCGLLDHMGGT